MSGAGYFGFTPGGTQYSASAYGAPTTGYAVTYAATHPYAGFQTATVTAPYGAYGATNSQPPTPQHQAQTGMTSSYATRIDNSTFASNSGSAGNKTGGNMNSNAKSGGKVSTYTGYDAAVYAAATSYLQSKAAGAGSQWLGLKKSGAAGGATGGGVTSGGHGHAGGAGGGGGRGSFPRRSGMGRGGGSGGSGGGVQQLHYCDVCKISCAGPQTYREHLEGQKHKKKEAQAKTGSTQPLARTKASFRCDLCGVTCTGQDTYNAHVRGAKHQKTLKLHQTLGKPIPSTEPVIIPPAGQINTKTSETNNTPLGTKKVVGVPKMNFVGGSKLATTGIGPQEISVGGGATPQPNQDAIDAALALEKDVQPVGEDYVEPIKDHTGKIVQFFCKLCDCKFNDLNAKDMHLKGRRHRLQFKKKVNPELEVDLKPIPGRPNRRASEEKLRKELMRLRQQELWSMRAMYQQQMMPPMMGGGPQPLFPGAGGPRSGETSDDRHVMEKHGRIYPTDEELNAVQRIVANSEKALKGVSDHFAEEEKKKTGVEEKKPEATAEGEEKGAAEDEKAPTEGERLLKGVMRVGLLAKGLLLRGDLNVTLVVLCSEKPTQRLLRKVFELLPKQLEGVCPDEKYSVTMGLDHASITVSSTVEPKAVVRVALTSVLMRETEGEAANKPDEKDVLDKAKCLDALADLRHAKWFQTLELLVEKVLTSAGIPLSPGESLRRIFEAVASGVLLPNGPGLLDPCEKDVIDATNALTAQQREDITSSAQHALRLIAFNQLYKILGIERLPDKTTSARKRPRESTEGTEAGDDGNGKKDKKEGEEMEVKEAA